MKMNNLLGYLYEILMHLPLFLQPSILHELKKELIKPLHLGGDNVIEQLHSSPKSFSLHSMRVSSGAMLRR